MKRDTRIVHSTTDGDLRKVRDPGLAARRADGGRVKVRREVGGRRGKAVTTIEIQGDHRDVVMETLTSEGYTPVLSGG